MKKIFTFIATAMLAVGANAQITWQQADETAPGAGTKIIDNDLVTVETVYATTAKKTSWEDDNFPQKTDGFEFDYYIQVRTADNASSAKPDGGESEGSTPLIVTAKKDATVTFYFRRQKGSVGFDKDDGKDLQCFAQIGSTPTSEEEVIITNEDKVTPANYAHVKKTYKFVEGGVYTIHRKSSTIYLYAIDVAESAAEPEVTIPNAAPVKVTWSLSDLATTAVCDPATAAQGDATCTVGAGMEILEETKAYNDIEFMQFQPTTGEDKGKNEYANAKELNKYIDFTFTPSALFAVTKVTFDAIKIGTGDPQIFIDLIDGDGQANTVDGPTDIQKNEEVDAPKISHTYDVKTKPSTNAVTLRIYVGKLASNKQLGLANVVIEGNIDGATGIESVKTSVVANGTIYNLAGQKVDTSYKGIVIQNGKKFVQK